MSFSSSSSSFPSFSSLLPSSSSSSSPFPALLPPCNSSLPWRPLGKMLDLFVLPLVCLSGLFLNIACIVVFAQRKTVVLYYFSSTAGGTFSGGGGSFLQNASGGGSSPPRKLTLEIPPISRSRLNSTMANGNCQNGNGAERDEYHTMRTRQAKRRSHPLVPVLIVLCVCDSLQLLFSLLVLYLPALHDHLEMDPLGWIAQLAYLATGCLAGGLLASNCASIWTMCYISIQRHRAIVRPLSTISAPSKFASHLPLLLISLFALLFNLPVWFEFEWAVQMVRTADGAERRLIWHSKSQMAQNEMYRFVMHKILYPLCVYLIPVVLISVLNIRILTFIHSSARVQSVGHRRRMAKERRSVWLLISIVLLFFLCHTGGLVIRLVDLRQYGNEPCFVFAKDLVNFLFNINSFANPMLYFFFTKQFRDLRTTWASSQSRPSNNAVGATNVAQQILRRKEMEREEKRQMMGANGRAGASDQIR